MILNKETGNSLAVKKGNGERKTLSNAVKLLLDNFVWLLVVALLVVAYITTPTFFRSTNLEGFLIERNITAFYRVKTADRACQFRPTRSFDTCDS